jgi:hypothetical protein
VGTARKETAVKVYHAVKSLQLLNVLRGGTRVICGGVLGRRGGTYRQHRVLKKFQRWNSKNALLQIDGEAIGGQSGKNYSK